MSFGAWCRGAHARAPIRTTNTRAGGERRSAELAARHARGAATAGVLGDGHVLVSTPARAASREAAIAPPSVPMNSRRRIRNTDRHATLQGGHANGGGRYHTQTCCAAGFQTGQCRRGVKSSQNLFRDFTLPMPAVLLLAHSPPGNAGTHVASNRCGCALRRDAAHLNSRVSPVLK
jgi:hypothetical protein